MSTIKTKIDSETINLIINQISPFLPENPKVIPIKGGEISQAYELVFSEGTTPLILRINSQDDKGFWKDMYAYNHFVEKGIEVPRIINNGQFGKYYYSLSEKCKGNLLDTLYKNEGLITEQQLFSQLLMIYTIKPMGNGYGVWDSTLNAPYSSMGELAKHDLRVEPVDLKDRGFNELKLHENVRQKSLELIKYLNEDRYLIHGDIGYNNTCASEGQITGIFDWAESSYGDFVLDIAWLMFWNSNALKSDVKFREYYDSIPTENKPLLNFSNYQERIKYFLFVIGYGSLCFFAKTENPGSYAYVIKVLKNWNLL